MTELDEARQALDWIKGEVSFIDSYFSGDFATWYNTVCKTRKRSRIIKEKCDIIIECMNKMEAEYEKKWDLLEKQRDGECIFYTEMKPIIKEPQAIACIAKESYADILEESKTRMEMQNSLYLHIGKYFVEKYSKNETNV